METFVIMMKPHGGYTRIPRSQVVAHIMGGFRIPKTNGTVGGIK